MTTGFGFDIPRMDRTANQPELATQVNALESSRYHKTINTTGWVARPLRSPVKDWKHILKRPLVAFLIWTGVWFLLYSTGGFFLSNGWYAVDHSSFPELLYFIFCYLLPLSIVAGIVHIGFTIYGSLNATVGLGMGLVGGITGSLVLHFQIQESGPEVFSYNLLPWIFTIYGVVAFLLATMLTFLIRNRLGEPDGACNRINALGNSRTP